MPTLEPVRATPIDGPYDALYAARRDSDLWGPQPGRLLPLVHEWSSDRGTALDAGCGDGKNASFLIEKGWEVQGFDVSKLAIKLLKRRIDQQYWDRFETEDLDGFLSRPFDRQYDLLLSYGLYHCLNEGRFDLHRKLQALVSVHGLIAFTCLTDGLPVPPDHGTHDLLLASDSEIDRLFQGYEVLHDTRGVISEHHLPIVGNHSHACRWIIARRMA